jgi:PAS domain S-box-containing protein
MIRRTPYEAIERDLDNFKRVLKSLKKNRKQIVSTLETNESRIEEVLNDLVEEIMGQLAGLREDKEKLTEDAEFAEDIIENSPDMLAVIDKENKWIKVNLSWKRVWGWSPEKLLGNKTEEQPFLLPGRVKGLEERTRLRREKLSKGETVREEAELLAKDGSKRVAQVMEKALEREGEIWGRVVAATDITELRKREAEFEEAKKFNQSLIENLPAAIWMSNESGKCCLVNKEFTRLLGWEKEELMGKRAFDSPFVCKSGSPYMKEGFKEAVRKIWESTKEKGGVGMRKVPYLTKDGQILILKTTEIPYEKGWARLEASIDVTELCKRELEFNQTLSIYKEEIDRVTQKGELSARINVDTLSEKYKQLGEGINKMVETMQNKLEELRRSQDIINNLPIGVVTCKADDPEKKWERVNPTLEKITGYSTGEMLGKRTEIQPFNTEDAIKIITKQREKYGEMPVYEIPWITKAGEHIIVRISVGNIKDTKGNITDYIFTVQDVTKEHEPESTKR